MQLQIYLTVLDATVAAQNLKMVHGHRAERVREDLEVMVKVPVKNVMTSQNCMIGSTSASWDYCPWPSILAVLMLQQKEERKKGEYSLNVVNSWDENWY